MNEPQVSWRDWQSVSYPTFSDGCIQVLALSSMFRTLNCNGSRRRLRTTSERVRTGSFARCTTTLHSETRRIDQPPQTEAFFAQLLSW
jgi:hypothetical protein